jgi:hypothetical protein
MELGEIAPRRIANEHHIAPLASIPTIRSALRHMRLAPEGHAARPASAGSYEDPGAVMEHPAIVVLDGLRGFVELPTYVVVSSTKADRRRR